MLMKPAWLLAVGLTTASLATSGFAQQIDFDKVQIITDQMAPSLYMRKPRAARSLSKAESSLPRQVPNIGIPKPTVSLPR